MQRDNIAVADRRKRYQTEVQELRVAIAYGGSAALDRPGTQNVDGAVKREPLHSEKQVNADRRIEMTIVDSASIFQVAKEGNGAQPEESR